MANALNIVTFKKTSYPVRRWLSLSVGCALLGLNAAMAEDLAPLIIKLPAPAFVGTPEEIPVGSTVEPPSKTPRAPLMVPKDVKNIAAGKKVTCSDTNVLAVNLLKVIDGDKEATHDGIVLLRKGSQWVQLDLGGAQELFAVVVWHAHDAPKVYHDVILQVADDAGFTKNVRTLFNNDQDNTSKQGVGTDREYFETNEGKLINTKGEKASFVRLYSKGSTDSAMNEYTEVEIYGRAVK